MLGKTLVIPLVAPESAPSFYLCMVPNLAIAAPSSVLLNLDSCSNNRPRTIRSLSSICISKRWVLNSTAETDNIAISDEDHRTWEACRQALSTYNFGVDEEDKILGKAFGQLHSPYWGEERKKAIPRFEIVDGVLDYLRSLGLSDEDLSKMLKKFPEVLGCSLEEELKANVVILEKQWGIKGSLLRNLLIRNPKVLGYNVDCKGDCMAQCTRCWVRF